MPSGTRSVLCRTVLIVFTRYLCAYLAEGQRDYRLIASPFVSGSRFFVCFLLCKNVSNSRTSIRRTVVSSSFASETWEYFWMKHIRPYDRATCGPLGVPCSSGPRAKSSPTWLLALGCKTCCTSSRPASETRWVQDKCHLLTAGGGGVHFVSKRLRMTGLLHGGITHYIRNYCINY